MSLHRQLKLLPFSVALLLLANVAQANAQDTKLKWFGHAAFSITTPKGKVLLIDPWLSNPSNPDVKSNKDPLAAVPKVDYILLTHVIGITWETQPRSQRKRAQY